MIIPFSYNKKFNIGDVVVLLEDYSGNFFKILKGHELIYNGKIYNYSEHKLLDEETGLIIKIDNNKFTHKISLNDARIKYKNMVDRKKFNDFIHKNCPNKIEEIYDREMVEVCKFNPNKYYINECKACKDCFKYIDPEKYKNNDFIIKYSRKLKINKLWKKQQHQEN